MDCATASPPMRRSDAGPSLEFHGRGMLALRLGTLIVMKGIEQNVLEFRSRTQCVDARYKSDSRKRGRSLRDGQREES